jgi:hypothetical protein
MPVLLRLPRHIAAYVAISLSPLALVSPAKAQVQIAISGIVQPVCRVDARLSHGSGEVKELCNVAAGYDLFLDYPPEAAGSALTIDGKPLALAPSGSTLVASSAGPAVRTRAVTLAAPAGVADRVFSFRIVSR